jgi:hypothetical protein
MSKIKERQPVSFPWIVKRGATASINSQSIFVTERDKNGKVSEGYGTVTITNGGAGYAVGCEYTKTDTTSGVSATFINIGSDTACRFVQVGVELSADVTVSTAELLALNATPKTLVAAPGAGFALVPTGMVLFLDFNSVVYNGVAEGEDLSVKYTDGSGTEAMQIEATGLLDASADAVRYAKPPTTLLTPTANAALVLHMLSGEIATGNSPLKVRIYYRVIPATL